jgi:hypothetical protein
VQESDLQALGVERTENDHVAGHGMPFLENTPNKFGTSMPIILIPWSMSQLVDSPSGQSISSLFTPLKTFRVSETLKV